MLIGIIFFVLSVIVGSLFFLVISSEHKKSIQEENEELEREFQDKQKR